MLVIVAVGGLGFDTSDNNEGFNSDLQESELLLDDLKNWISGPRMPGYLFQGATASNAEGSRLVLIGGSNIIDPQRPESLEIFLFGCSNHVCSFEKVR